MPRNFSKIQELAEVKDVLEGSRVVGVELQPTVGVDVMVPGLVLTVETIAGERVAFSVFPMFALETSVRGVQSLTTVQGGLRFRLAEGEEER